MRKGSSVLASGIWHLESGIWNLADIVAAAIQQTSFHELACYSNSKVALFPDRLREEIMSDIGWYKIQTYTHNSISQLKYIELVLQNPLPLSGLYLWIQLAESAYQLPEGWVDLFHMR